MKGQRRVDLKTSKHNLYCGGDVNLYDNFHNKELVSLIRSSFHIDWHLCMNDNLMFSPIIARLTSVCSPQSVLF